MSGELFLCRVGVLAHHLRRSQNLVGEYTHPTSDAILL
jgi:hypothetical protein